MLLNQDYQHLTREEDERNNIGQNVPTLEGDGASFAIPHSAYFSKQVLNMTDMSRTYVKNIRNVVMVVKFGIKRRFTWWVGGNTI